MKRCLALAALALALGAGPLQAAGVTGKYIEARTCDVWTGPCFANAEVNLVGKHAVLAWKVDSGSFAGARLDGLGVVAVVAASDTLGLKQTGKGKAVLLVDSRATPAQKDALVRLARRQGGDLLRNVVAVRTAPVELEICPCTEGGCGKLSAGPARIETRCLNGKHDKVCGNESAFFPPLSHGVKATPAMAVEHSFSGRGVDQVWSDGGKRSAYLGTFSAR